MFGDAFIELNLLKLGILVFFFEHGEQTPGLPSPSSTHLHIKVHVWIRTNTELSLSFAKLF